MARQKCKLKIDKDNNSKALGGKVMVLSAALLHNVLYQCMKFQVESLHSLEVMARTKFDWTDGRTYSQNLKGVYSKKFGRRVMVLTHCNFPKCRLSVYVVLITFISLEIMARTKIQSKDQQRAITQTNVAELWLLCTAFFHNVLYQCVMF